MSDSLKAKSIRAFLWDILGSFSTQGVQFIISIILARILSPEDFGLIGMSMVVVAISQIFADLGFSSALIQSQNNTDRTYNSVFVFNIALGLLLLLITVLLAGPVSSFYDEPIIKSIVLILSPSIVISSFNIIQLAILKKELKFKELNIRLFFSSLISGVIAIVLALSGYEFYALAIQILLFQIVSTIVLWKVSEWKPTLEFSFQEIKRLWKFSIYIFLEQALNQFINKLDALVIGKLFSPKTLGFFTRAESLNAMLISLSSGSLGKVFYPAVSQIQEDKIRFKNTFLKVISLSSILAFFFSGILILSSEFIIIFLFGEKWRPTIAIFQILMYKMYCYPVSIIIVNSLKALGLAKQHFWYGNIRVVLRLIPFFIAYFYGFTAFLYAFVVTSIIGTFFNNFIASKHLYVTIKEQAIGIYKFGVFFLAAYFIAKTLSEFVSINLFFDMLLRNSIYILVFGLLLRMFSPDMMNFLKTEIQKIMNYLWRKEAL